MSMILKLVHVLN